VEDNGAGRADIRRARAVDGGCRRRWCRRPGVGAGCRRRGKV